MPTARKARSNQRRRAESRMTDYARRARRTTAAAPSDMMPRSAISGIGPAVCGISGDSLSVGVAEVIGVDDDISDDISDEVSADVSDDVSIDVTGAGSGV